MRFCKVLVLSEFPPFVGNDFSKRMALKEFSNEELARYNGKDGVPAYVAYKGKVYDVSTSFLWNDGTHQVLHVAGVDLTDAVEQAPHGGGLLEKFPVVGTLRGAGTAVSRMNGGHRLGNEDP
jgi:predicted heme/steroid binding protein